MNGILSKQQPVFRFAPSPNGLLHLGHALSALVNQQMADAWDGRLLLRMEDIDTARCTPQYEQAIEEDLAWLGVTWERPVRRQSEHFDLYREALASLRERGLVYPSFLSRGEIRSHVLTHEAAGTVWPRDPDGAAHYPGDERDLRSSERQAMLDSGKPHAWRLDMRKALSVTGADISWQESGHGPAGETGTVRADPAAWGDVILSRSDAPSSYHLSVTLDDAIQGVTHVVRGRDLFHATSVHRLLQRLLELPEPLYHHHRLILDPEGRKLSKRDRDTGIAALRTAGKTADEVRSLVL